MRKTALTLSTALAALLVLASPQLAQDEPPPQAELEVDLRPREAEVGDLIAATLTVSAPPEAIAPPVFPEWDGTWGEAEVRDIGPIETVDATRFRQEVTFTVFRTGEVTLPPVAIEIPTAEALLRVESEPRTLTIRSVLPPDVENPEARPPAPPRALPLGQSFVRTALALTAACLAAAFLLARRRARALGEGMAPVPPLEALARGLDSLSKVREGEAFYTALSLHLRRFLGRSFGFPALESTTTEVRHRLTEAATPRALVSQAERILRHCDFVKFAGGVPADHQGATPSSRLDEVLALGRELDRHLHPPEPAAPEQRTEQAA